MYNNNHKAELSGGGETCLNNTFPLAAAGLSLPLLLSYSLSWFEFELDYSQIEWVTHWLNNWLIEWRTNERTLFGRKTAKQPHKNAKRL